MKRLYFKDNLKLFLSSFTLFFLGLKTPQTTNLSDEPVN